MDSFFERANAICRRCDVLRHPFYQRWTRGELERRELGHYAGQYRHAVVALADASAHAADNQHADEERGHIALETKRTGLVVHYGAAPVSDATRYFDLHAVVDTEHAEQDRRELAGLMGPAEEERLLAEMERVLTANWRLLDGVQAACDW